MMKNQILKSLRFPKLFNYTSLSKIVVETICYLKHLTGLNFQFTFLINPQEYLI